MNWVTVSDGREGWHVVILEPRTDSMPASKLHLFMSSALSQCGCGSYNAFIDNRWDSLTDNPPERWNGARCWRCTKKSIKGSTLERLSPEIREIFNIKEGKQK